MKVAVFDPRTGRRIGLTSLKRDVQPGVLGLAGFRAGTHLGEPVMRTRTYPQDADSTRRAWQRLTFWAEVTGWSARVETNAREAEALYRSGVVPNAQGVYRLIHSGSHLSVLSGHGTVTR